MAVLLEIPYQGGSIRLCQVLVLISTPFKPHSTREEELSKTKTASVYIKKILDTAGWSYERTLDRSYKTSLQRESL